MYSHLLRIPKWPPLVLEVPLMKKTVYNDERRSIISLGVRLCFIEERFSWLYWKRLEVVSQKLIVINSSFCSVPKEGKIIMISFLINMDVLALC